MYCKNCGQEVEQNAKFCPECGATVGPEQQGKKGNAKKPIFKQWWFRVLIIILVVSFWGGGNGEEASNSSAGKKGSQDHRSYLSFVCFGSTPIHQQ